MIVYELSVYAYDDEVPTRVKVDEILKVVDKAECPAGVHLVVQNIKVIDVYDRPKGQKEK